ncbi:hypothetical protein DEI81_11885 [Curtobacterium sp. MCBD17_013]|uniref:TetR/AcrR family transcriptional regulator n=1 Tax=Curtobacterium sp. MCBD17_013 TaxID=2175668 RepID=UPI000DA70F56|nr:TetR/AcrR family transcriptional regulator [Curtobacterium sp. MCBD17_013]PZF60699.1 hypothetical protein DEI81_11885 [Curtobacterium sp. MCBD17_013]
MDGRGSGAGEVTSPTAREPDGSGPAPLGLRERKREETRRRIIRAARAGCLAVGMEHLTIDTIARDADISPRSFFNYFSNKEAAIAGVVPGTVQTLTADELDRLPTDLVDAVVTIVIAVLGRQVDSEHGDLRREVFARYPQLLDELRPIWKASVQSATMSVAELLRQRGVAADRSGIVAPTLVAMCVAVVRSMLSTGALDSVDVPREIGAVVDALRSTVDVINGNT